MLNHKNHQNLIISTSIAIGALGILSTILNCKRKDKRWTSRAQDIAHHMIENSEMLNKKIILGGVAGGFIGATVALLFAPKAGRDLVTDICHSLTRIAKVVANEFAEERASSESSEEPASSESSEEPASSVERKKKPSTYSTIKTDEAIASE